MPVGPHEDEFPHDPMMRELRRTRVRLQQEAASLTVQQRHELMRSRLPQLGYDLVPTSAGTHRLRRVAEPARGVTATRDDLP
ncbi:MAG: hypothetical protein ACE5O2_05525 [Armatimonadota bacterium]